MRNNHKMEDKHNMEDYLQMEDDLKWKIPANGRRPANLRQPDIFSPKINLKQHFMWNQINCWLYKIPILQFVCLSACLSIWQSVYLSVHPEVEFLSWNGFCLITEVGIILGIYSPTPPHPPTVHVWKELIRKKKILLSSKATAIMKGPTNHSIWIK